MANILILYSSIDGHTLRICQRLQHIIEQENNQVTLLSLSEHPEIDPAAFDKIVIGASIRYGHHRPEVYQFIKQHLSLLNSQASAFFSVNVVARKPGKNTVDTNPYMRIFRKKTAWHPRESAVFAGRIEYRLYNIWNRQIIRLIMWITQGPTHADTAEDFTDWHKVAAFGQRIARM